MFTAEPWLSLPLQWLSVFAHPCEKPWIYGRSKQSCVCMCAVAKCLGDTAEQLSYVPSWFDGFVPSRQYWGRESVNNGITRVSGWKSGFGDDHKVIWCTQTVRYACIEGGLICPVCISWLRYTDQNCDPSRTVCVTMCKGQIVILNSEVKFLSSSSLATS